MIKSLTDPCLDSRLIIVERWLVWLLPVALVSASGTADVLCTVLALLFLGRSLVRRDFSWANRTWIKVLLLLWAYLCVRSLLAINPLHSVASALIWLRFPVFAIALSHHLRHDETRRRLIVIASWSVLLVSADAILQYFAGFDMIGRPVASGMRLTGPFGRPYVGITIAWLFVPPLMGLVEQRRFILAGALCCAALLAITLSGERMAFVIFGLDAIMLAILLPSWRWVIVLAVGGAVAIVGVIFVFEPTLFDRQFLSIGRTAAALGQSQYGVIWTRATSIIAAHPVFGIGMDEYRFVCLDPIFGSSVVGDDGLPHCSTHPHNFYLEWLLAGGVPALALFVAAMALLLKDLIAEGNVGDVMFAGLLATLVGRLWFLAPTTSFFYGWSAIPLFLYIGWSLAYLPRSDAVR